MSRLEPLAATRGQLVVTDGAVDLRLTVERGLIELEVKWRPLPKEQPADVAIARTMLETLFWDSPAMDLASGAHARAGAADDGPRLRVERPDAPRELCRAIADEAANLEPVRRRIASLGVFASATPTTGNAKGGDTLAGKLRRALATKGGDLSLLEWAHKEGLHPVDAAATFADLLEAGEAKISKKQDVTAQTARIEAGLAGGGFVPGLRLEGTARALAPREAARAAQAFCRAGWERLAAGRSGEASDDFEQALALLSPEKGSSSGERLDTSDVALEAREGLVVAVESESGRRPSSGSSDKLDVRPLAAIKRASVELGRAYLALGFANRARVGLERGLEENASPGTQLELIGALIKAAQLSRALERAEALAPRLDRAQRRQIAERIVEAGAKGPTLDRALALAGAGKDRSATAALLVGTALFLTIAALFGREAQGRTQLAQAADEVRSKLKTAPVPAEAQANLFSVISANFAPFPCASDAEAIANRVRDLAHDGQELKTRAAALSWKNGSREEARAKLVALRDAAHTPELKVPVEGALARLDRWEKDAKSEIQLVRDAATRGDTQTALDGARRLIDAYPTFQDQWKTILVPIAIEVTPETTVVVEWNGRKIDGPPYLVTFPMDMGAAGVVRVSGEASQGFIPQERRLVFAEVSSVVQIALERKAGFTPKHTTPPVGPNGTVTTPPVKPKIKITEDPTGPPKPSSDDPTPPKKARFEVTEVSGDSLKDKLGVSGTVEVQSSPGFFDFLKREVPSNLRLTVEVVTSVHDGKAFFDGVNLKLEDSVLGKPISPLFVAEDPPCERPMRATTGGGRSVEPLTRALHLDKEKLKETIRDELRVKIEEFNRAEAGR